MRKLVLFCADFVDGLMVAFGGGIARVASGCRRRIGTSFLVCFSFSMIYDTLESLSEAKVRALDTHKANTDALSIDAICYLMGFVTEYRCSLPCGDIFAPKKSNWSDKFLKETCKMQAEYATRFLLF